MPKDMEFTVLLDIYGAMLTEKQSDTLSLYYNEDLSLAEIAENSGITRQGVHKCIRQGEDCLRELEEKLGLAGKYKEITVLTDSLAKLISDSSLDENEKKRAEELLEKIKNKL